MNFNQDDFLNASQLFKYKQAYSELHRKKSKFRPIKKLKTDHCFEISKHQEEIDKVLKTRDELLKTVRVKLPQDLGVVDWLENEKMSVFVKLKKKPQWIGIIRNQKVYLNSKETLFLLENESIIVNYHNIPLSLEDAYNLFFKTKDELEEYRIYSYLSRLGFRLKVHEPNLLNQSNQSKADSPPHFCEKKFNFEDHPYKDQLNQNQLDSQKSFITCFLQNDMFLKNQNNKPKNWQEYKGVKKSENETESKFKAIVVDAKSIPSLSHPLPNQSLISKNLKPIIDQTQLLKAEYLYSKLKANSCKTTKSLISPIKSLNISYDVYLPTKLVTPETVPNIYLIICKEKASFPVLKHFVQLEKDISSNAIFIFAVTRETDFNFYWIKPFTCWDEIPKI